MEKKSQKRLEAKIFGRVQGVGFRFFVLIKAQKLGLTGFVKNEYDGSVEVIAQGSEEDIKELLYYLKEGSPFSRVEKVTQIILPTQNEFNRFEIRH